MKRTTVLSITLYVASLALVAGLTAHGANYTPPPSPTLPTSTTSKPVCPNPCCDIDVQVAEMLEQLKDEERWLFFIHYQMGYPPFNKMSWNVTQAQASALMGQISATEIDLKIDLDDERTTPEERVKIVTDYKKKITEIRELRRQFIRDVCLKVYKIPAESLVHDVL